MGQSNSTEWSDVLDKFGYSDEGIKEQILVNTKEAFAVKHFLKDRLDDVDILYVGSRIEGTCLHGFGDADVLQILTKIQCFEDEAHDVPMNSTICRFIPAYSEGHGFIKVVSGHEVLDPSILEKWGDETYISSKKVMDTKTKLIKHLCKRDTCLDDFVTFGTPRGPSTPLIVKKDKAESLLVDSETEMDQTIAIPLHCPNILEKWLSRRRKFDWPPKELCNKIAALPAFLVPVGQTGGENEDLQWRICFNLAETLLVQSMNNTHKKLYISLKMIKESIFKDLCEDVSSFMLKNIVFWMAENQSTTDFVPEKLEDRIVDALLMFVNCLEDRKLPFYMIPERCLIEGKIPEWQIVVLIALNQVVINDYLDILNEHCEFEKRLPEIMVKILNNYYVERLRICKVSLFSVEDISNFLKRREKSSWYRPNRLWYYLYNVIKVGIPCFWKFGFKFFRDRRQIEHEKVLDPAIKFDDYVRFACEDCRKKLHSNVPRKRKCGQNLPSNRRKRLRTI